MSAIFGIVGNSGIREQVLSRMSEVLVHRGPDDFGTYVDERVALGCRLLRTRGPKEECQPISSDVGNVQAVLDGAIFNGDFLRKELEGSGHAFRTNSDAELLVRLYEEEGQKCVARLRGQFAFAIWDASGGRLILARDHLGQKPLFYAEDRSGFFFASELKGLAAALPANSEIDFRSLDHYLSMRFIPGSGTMLRGFRKLPPAHLLIVDRDGVSTSRYWSLSFARKVQMSHDEYIEGLEHKLQETVAAQLAAGDTTGAFLSGGLDSSLIVAMMAREVAEPVPTFSIGFAEKEFDEIPHARVVSEEFGTRQFEAQADTDLIGALPIIIKGLGEPSDPVALSFFSASRLAANHVKVALGGEGGNELFAGVDRYRGLRLATYYSFVPAPIRRAIIAPLIHRIPSSFGYNSLAIKLRWLQQMAETQDMGDRLAEAVSFFRFNQAEKDTLLTENVRQCLDPGSAAREISDRYHESDAESSVERMVYTDYCTRLPEHLLMLSDRMGMVHGLEVRAPLVDKELVEYMAAFPLAMKIRRNKARYIWYKLAERVLPASIASRKKRGFKLPLAYWFAVELHPFLRQVIQDSRLAAAGVFDRTYMLQILEEHRRRQIDHSWKIWMLLNLEMWYRMEIEGVSLEQAREWVERIASDA